MSDRLIKLLLKSISFIPGIAGIANINFSKRPVKLEEELWSNGIKIESSLSGNEISVAIIVDKDISAKLIAKELGSSISAILKKEHLDNAKLNIYVRGIE